MSFKKLLPIFFVMLSFGAKANYMLVQNVTKVGNNPTNKTIQIQFDLSWQNSWRDSINWDAAWIFIKFKDANGLWQHARLNLAGFANGAGTNNTIKVGSDSVGAFVYRDVLGSGNFNATSMQLQWNYGSSGLTDVSALEVRVFATEMVYVPEGDFNIAKNFYNSTNRTDTFIAPGSNFPVINNRLTPTLRYFDSLSVNIRIKGDIGIDTNNDGIIDNTSYPTGYKAFYCYKYELSEQQYADFLNTLTATQKTSVGVAGTGITLVNAEYFSSTPNKACGNSTPNRIFSIADWSGLRPLTILEFNKACFGPNQPVISFACYFSSGYVAWKDSILGSTNSSPLFNLYSTQSLNNVGFLSNSISTRASSGASYYGIMDLNGNANEPVVRMKYFNFSNINGDGKLNLNGSSNINTVYWNTLALIFIDAFSCFINDYNRGFRLVRSAE
jgi:hypothetical protein